MDREAALAIRTTIPARAKPRADTKTDPARPPDLHTTPPPNQSPAPPAATTPRHRRTATPPELPGSLRLQPINKAAALKPALTLRATIPARLRPSQGQPEQESAVALLEAAVAYFAKLGIRVERVMTDNGFVLPFKDVPDSL
jgi:hypothetical protein